MFIALIIILSLILIRVIDYVLARLIGFFRWNESDYYLNNSLIAEFILFIENKIKYGI